MKPSERAKQLGFKTLREAASVAGLSHKTLEKMHKVNIDKFDNTLIATKHKLTMQQIDFYRECADMAGVTFEEWMQSKDEI